MPAVQRSWLAIQTALVAGRFVGSGCDRVLLKALNHLIAALRYVGKCQ